MKSDASTASIATVDKITEAADRLMRAGQEMTPCEPIRDLIDAGDIDSAYRIQQINTERAISAGRRVVGCKIGLTSLAVQRQLGVGQPDFGMLFDDMSCGEGLPIPFGMLLQPRIETEVALILEKDVDLPRPTVGDVIRATAYVVPALEIVGSRIKNWDIRIADTVADNASSGMFVLGGPARRLVDLDLRATRMVMTRKGETVSEGSGAACQGSPLNAACWLIGEMARRERPLRAGDIILTGALGPMVSANAGDEFQATVDGLGTVSAMFSGDVK